MATERKTDYTNAAQQRILQLVLVMFGDVATGYKPAALARTLGCKAPLITRDLDNLKTAGVAELDEKTGCWRLTELFPQQADKVWVAMSRAGRNLDDQRNNIARTAFGR
jgi:DNA-binding IclR family transcriptional regulator